MAIEIEAEIGRLEQNEVNSENMKNIAGQGLFVEDFNDYNYGYLNDKKSI